MSAIAPPHDYPSHWVTPQQQLVQLGQSEPALLEAIKSVGCLNKDVAQIISNYSFEPNPHLSHWHTSLSKIGKLPPLHPPLPANLIEYLDSPCPERISTQKKTDGSPYTLGEKSILLLLPEELGSLKEFSKCILDYGSTQYGEAGPILNCQYVRKEANQDIPPPPTRWILATRDLLPGSRDKSYPAQVNLVHSLNQINPSRHETLIHWAVPELSDMVKAMFLTKIGTETMLYQSTDTTFTRTSNQVMNRQLAVGGYSCRGIKIIDNPDCTAIGLAALGMF